ncbi:EIICBA-Glc [Mycoplasmopsis californica]|uniref:PTS transporter subunit EIIC n=1 Tax=Mycoplasmopsis equigenitalium TaxID=114883 RepID=A0ABY5J0N7_9BACT|nr:PTS transporter subunit EIIC [Mycoplasmopsis equigenitalium]UUD36827.1 PTS transporter subunit EIIC [Mycoplasmopsis equigenitalium]VEU69876.1 EIICBA-Glc [Mycoplasmopsis californica]
MEKAIEQKSNSKKGIVKGWFQKLSRGLMLPIAILPIAGLLLGIGGAIGANVHTETGTIFANIFKGMSEVVFANLPILFAIAVAITFSNDRGGAGFAAVIAYLVFNASQFAFIQFDAVSGNATSVLWFQKVVGGVVVKNLGITSLNTSIFGGLVIGIVTAYTFNYFSKLQLPQSISFFSGIRLVPIVLVPIAFAVALVFLLVWPLVGRGIYEVGTLLQKSPRGLDGLIYGTFGRALMPFGLHHIPIIMAFQTEFGGVISYDQVDAALAAGKITAQSAADIKLAISNFTNGNTQVVGDQNIWNMINGMATNTMEGMKLFQFFDHKLGINAGRFTQDYPTYLGACMGIGLAIILAAEKQNRKTVAYTVGSAMLVAFLTGITEPLEFTFLFVSPALYYVVYVPFSGLAYALMSWSQAHVGVGFARGFIDLIIYGAIPVAKGTAFYWAFVWAILLGVLSFVIFYFWIVKGKIATPGRLGNNLGLLTKTQFNELKQGKNKASDKDILGIIEKLGGINNLKSVSACATRLRLELVDNIELKPEDFVEFGSFGLIQKGLSVQIIFGGKATIIADEINIIKDNETTK